jgi:hypothetical protein
MRIFICLFMAIILAANYSFGQVDSSLNKAAQFPNRFFARMNGKFSNLDASLTKQSEKYLKRLAKNEKRIQERLYQLDSNKAKNLFYGTQEKYSSLQKSIKDTGSAGGIPLSGEYLPYVDSIKTSLAFAQKNPDILKNSPKIQQEVNASVAQFNQLQKNFSNADQIKDYIRQRKEMMKDQLAEYVQHSNLKKYLDDYNKQVYYYSAQVREYKETLNDPDKMLKKALEILNKVPAFSRFIQQNGQLAGLFGLSADYGSAEGLVGLQTRDQVQQLLQGTISSGGSGGMAALQSSLQSAHQQLDNFKDKLSSLGSGSGSMDMPDFKPQNQKTKSFMKRLELGIDLQTTRANGWFPSTTCFGLSVGYKISNKTTVSVGGSYNVGWGTSIQHIHFTSQGVGIRSSIDVLIRKKISITGGFEENYTNAFTSLSQLQTTSMWQRSGLFGLSKMVSLPGKVVKKTKVSLLWDFLSYSNRPKTQALIFRVGYVF